VGLCQLEKERWQGREPTQGIQIVFYIPSVYQRLFLGSLVGREQ
jgi:hypothetical protein